MAQWLKGRLSSSRLGSAIRISGSELVARAKAFKGKSAHDSWFDTGAARFLVSPSSFLPPQPFNEHLEDKEVRKRRSTAPLTKK